MKSRHARFLLVLITATAVGFCPDEAKAQSSNSLAGPDPRDVPAPPIKSCVGRESFTGDISDNDPDILDGGFLRINLNSAGNTADDPVEGLIGYPLRRNFSFANVRVAKCSTLVEAAKIAAEKPFEGLSLMNITGNCTNGISLANITGVKLSNFQVTGYNGLLLLTTNVQVGVWRV